MADENTQGNTASAQTEKVELPKAEAESLRAKAATAERLEKLEARLKEMDFDGTPEEYIEGLEQAYTEEIAKNQKKDDKGQQAQQSGQQQNQQQNQQQQAAAVDDSKLQATNKVLSETKLSADLANFRIEQSRLKDEEKSLFEEAEIVKAIKDPGDRQIILSMLPKHNNNLFAAAEAYLTNTKGKAKMMERAEKIAEAKYRVADGSNVNLGGRAADNKPQTVEEWQTKERQSIAPPDKKYVIPG